MNPGVHQTQPFPMSNQSRPMAMTLRPGGRGHRRRRSFVEADSSRLPNQPPASAERRLGGFGAPVRPEGRRLRSDTLIVSTTDGVGTKLSIAIETGLQDRIGIDLGHMCVNEPDDQGAEPRCSWNYFATGQARARDRQEIVAGVARASPGPARPWSAARPTRCRGMYGSGDYDLAGFRSARSTAPQSCKAGRAAGGRHSMMGSASSGLHSTAIPWPARSSSSRMEWARASRSGGPIARRWPCRSRRGYT